ncbi:chaperonin 10-like protein [Rhypophila decipiens]|uniref:Chaperonin 10-like protein n=1 Tax=Rhypophila decipiens TaxID=261697 RepID=A0AAN6YF24_9PEZI|nr:chaperonin 10-like protein [Rhypophila decipiens]
MKEAFVSEDLKVQIIDTPIPELTAPDQILIKVVVTGTNPKDWKAIRRYTPQLEKYNGANTGDDIAGVVEQVGSSVYEFKPGDRVAAFHEMMTPAGSFAEYAIAYQHCTFHIPPTTTFEEAAALPLAAMTAAIGLYRNLGLPQPWSPPNPSPHSAPLPLIIYGASSAVGFYALQFALKSNIHPLICVAGRAGNDYILPYLDKSKGDVLIDYRDGQEKVIDAILKSAPKGGSPPILHAFDAVSEHGSPFQIAQVFAAQQQQQTGSSSSKPKVTFVLAGPKEGIPDDGSVESSITLVADAHNPDNGREFAHVYFRYISLGLAEGWFKGHRQEVIPGGLAGVRTALENLKGGKASGIKYVMRIGETEGVARK